MLHGFTAAVSKQFFGKQYMMVGAAPNMHRIIQSKSKFMSKKSYVSKDKENVEIPEKYLLGGYRSEFVLNPKDVPSLLHVDDLIQFYTGKTRKANSEK